MYLPNNIIALISLAVAFSLANAALNLQPVGDSISVYSLSPDEKSLRFPIGLSVKENDKYAVFGRGAFFSYGQQLTTKQVLDIDLGFSHGSYCILVPKDYRLFDIQTKADFKISSIENTVISTSGRSFEGTILNLKDSPYSQLIFKGHYVSALASCFGGNRVQLLARVLTSEEQLQKIVPSLPDSKPYDFSDGGLTRVVEINKGNYRLCVNPETNRLPQYLGSCYMTYTNAVSFCESLGMRLPTLEDVITSKEHSVSNFQAYAGIKMAECNSHDYYMQTVKLTLRNGNNTKQVCYQKWGESTGQVSLDNFWTSSDLMASSEWVRDRYNRNERFLIGLRDTDFKTAALGQKAVWDKSRLRAISYPATDSERLQVRCARLIE